MSLNLVRRMVAPLRTQIANLVARAVVKLVTDSVKMQVLQLEVLDGETRDGCERVQQYGLTSVPLEGAEAVVLFVGGRRDHPLVVAVDDRRHRKKDLQPGEVALYTDEGATVYLKRGRIVIDDSEIRLGSDAASNFVALSNLVSTQLSALKTALIAAAVGPSFLDGGVSYAANLTTQLATWPGSVAAGKVKAE
jgi:phage baseplate assembly protein V